MGMSAYFRSGHEAEVVRRPSLTDKSPRLAEDVEIPVVIYGTEAFQEDEDNGV